MTPGYLLVAGRGSGPAVEQTLRLGGPYLSALWIGAAGGLALAYALGWVLPERVVLVGWRRTRAALVRPSAGAFALLAGALAAALATWVSLGVLARQPILLDGVSQLVQARYFAAGRLAGPRLEDPAFWQFQFMVPSDAGWTSQYPPGFPALLALAGHVLPLWLVGPLVLGCAVALVALVAERLCADDPVVGRLGVALTAFSPFLAFHAAGYMSHVLALALVALAMHASLRARGGRWQWALLCGVALGAAFAARPYTAVALGLVATGGAWLLLPSGRALDARAWAARLGAVALGAAPFVLAVLAYNRRLFGGALEFGYTAGEGPGHGIGFHVDPWGNPYGAREALGYTAADLQGLSLDLLQSPLPVALLVALYLLAARRLAPGVRVVAAWALVPVLAQALYWHHDLFMGPRLLYEAGPAWCLLFAAGAVGLVRALPESGSWWGLRRVGVAGTVAFSLLLALLYSGPGKLLSYRTVAVQSGMNVTAPTVGRPAVVFVHSTWEDRVAARLAAAGMRVDSIRAALLHNSTCQVELYVDRLAAAGPRASALRFSGDPAHPLRSLRMPSGSIVRTYPGEKLEPRCRREAASDYEGAVGLPPLLWQGDLPGLDGAGAMFVRDLGPERNAELIGRFPEREPRTLTRREGGIVVEPYEVGEGRLWKGR